MRFTFWEYSGTISEWRRGAPVPRPRRFGREAPVRHTGASNKQASALRLVRLEIYLRLAVGCTLGGANNSKAVLVGTLSQTAIAQLLGLLECGVRLAPLLGRNRVLSTRLRPPSFAGATLRLPAGLLSPRPSRKGNWPSVGPRLSQAQTLDPLQN